MVLFKKSAARVGICLAAMALVLTGCPAKDFDPTAIPAPEPASDIDCNLIFPAPLPDGGKGFGLSYAE